MPPHSRSFGQYLKKDSFDSDVAGKNPNEAFISLILAVLLIRNSKQKLNVDNFVVAIPQTVKIFVKFF